MDFHIKSLKTIRNGLHDSHLFLPPGRYPSTPPPSCSGWRCSCRPRTGRPPAFSPVSLFVTSESPLSQFSILVGFQHKEPRRVGPLDDDARPNEAVTYEAASDLSVLVTAERELRRDATHSPDQDRDERWRRRSGIG